MNFQDLLKQVVQASVMKRPGGGTATDPTNEWSRVASEYPINPEAEQGVLDELNMLQEQATSASELGQGMPPGLENPLQAGQKTAAGSSVLWDSEKPDPATRMGPSMDPIDLSGGGEDMAMGEIDLSPEKKAMIHSLMQRLGIAK
ncbi:MAG: hypothetical protein R6U98_06635 [Pirellulaceae bacterium]